MGVSLFSGGALPLVLAHDERTDVAHLRDRLREELSQAARTTTGRLADRIAAALARVDAMQTASAHDGDAELLVVETPTELSFGLSAELAVRTKEPTTGSSSVLRADLF